MYLLILKKNGERFIDFDKIDTTVSFDMRAYVMRKMKNLSVRDTIKWLYPRCIRLDLWLQQQQGETKSRAPLERLSYDRFSMSGIYWIESHDDIYLWIGQYASSDLVQSIFGVSDIHQINPNMNQLPVLDNPINAQLRVIYSIATDNKPYLPQFNVIRHGLDLEIELSKVLIEDESFNQTSYVDYLCMIHKQIQTEVKKKKLFEDC